MKLTSGTLRTQEDVEAWLDETRKALAGKLKDGPVVIS